MTNEADTVKVEDLALAEFTEYFVRNYPGPDTIIGDPKWHAPKIFRAARHALRRLPHEAEGSAKAEPFNTGAGWENLSCDDQYDLARRIASNVGYVLVAEPEIEPWRPPVSPSSIPDPGKSPSAAREHIKGTQVAQMIMDFWSDFSSAYPKDVMTSSLCAVGPLQAMIGLAIERGNLAIPDPGLIATHRHKRRGTEYVLIGYGKMQAETWADEAQRQPLGAVTVDMREVAIYRSTTDPTEIWVRPREEFEDGRFEALKGGKPWANVAGRKPRG